MKTNLGRHLIKILMIKKYVKLGYGECGYFRQIKVN